MSRCGLRLFFWTAAASIGSWRAPDLDRPGEAWRLGSPLDEVSISTAADARSGLAQRDKTTRLAYGRRVDQHHGQLPDLDREEETRRLDSASDEATQLAGGCSVDQHGGERPIWTGPARPGDAARRQMSRRSAPQRAPDLDEPGATKRRASSMDAASTGNMTSTRFGTSPARPKRRSSPADAASISTAGTPDLDRPGEAWRLGSPLDEVSISTTADAVVRRSPSWPMTPLPPIRQIILARPFGPGWAWSLLLQDHASPTSRPRRRHFRE